MDSIKATPFDFPLGEGEGKPCLVIIDMQRDFIEPGGFGEALGNDVSLLRSAIAPCQALLKSFRKLGLPVVHTREAHKADLSDCPSAKRLRGDASLRIGDEGPMGRILIDGEPGNDIITELKPINGEFEITKPGKGAFYDTSLTEILTQLGSNQLIFAGVTTEVCVQTTMREANDRGYQCLLCEDATASYFPKFKQDTLDMITAQGAIVGWVAPSSLIIKALETCYG